MESFPPIPVLHNGFVAELPVDSNPRKRRWKGGGVFLPTGRAARDLVPMMMMQPLLPVPRRRRAKVLSEAIFAGRVQAHFGHFIAESVGRLWACDEFPPDMPLLWFSDQRPRDIEPIRRAVLDLLGIDNPLIDVSDIIQVESLHLPDSLSDPMFGVAPDPRLQAWIAARLPPVTSGPDLYVSRSNLSDRNGRFLGEAALESVMAAQGYRVFHPQEHPLAEQVATLRSARRIVMAEGSPLHLAALLGTKGQRVAVIQRRPLVNDELLSAAAGLDMPVTVISRLLRCWVKPERLGVFTAVSELDLGLVLGDLAAAGFIKTVDRAALPSPREIDAEHQKRAPERSFDLGTRPPNDEDVAP